MPLLIALLEWVEIYLSNVNFISDIITLTFNPGWNRVVR